MTLALIGTAALPWYAFVEGHPFRIRYMVVLGAMVAVGLLVERLDFALRRWHVAGLSLVVLTLLFAAAMSGAR